MIICKHCGNSNGEQDTFCASCGAFLEWSGERVTEPAAGQPAASAPAPPAPPPPAPQPAAAPPAPQPAAAPPQPPGPYPAPRPAAIQPAAAPPAPQPAAPPQPPGPYPAPQPYTPPDAAAQPPPAAGQPRGVPPQPEAVRPTPQLQRPAPRAVAPAGPAAAAGDVPCPSCGAGNEPNRHFCRRCGSALGAPAAAQPGGWALAAGERPAGMRPGATGGGLWSGLRSFLVAMLAALVLGSGLAFAVLPGFRAAVGERANAVVTAIRRQVSPSYVPTRPVQAQASSSVPGHGPQLTIDLVNNDYWAADTARDRQPVLTLSFSTPTDLDYVIVTTGAGTDYASLARPRDVRITYSDGTTQDLTLKDDPKATGYPLSAHQVTSASIRILSVYPSSRSTAVAIAELEFFRLS